jgi:uncharacterized membrane protein (UPF0127 family)
LVKLHAINHTRHCVLVTNGIVADTWWTRLKGLLGRPSLQPGEGLLLRGEKAIHTIGMRFPIDVLFLDSAHRVVHLIPTMGAQRFSPFVARASDVLELPAGIIAETGTMLGDQIEITFT